MSSLNKKLILAFLFIFMLGSFGFYIIDKATKSRIDNIGIIGKVPSFSLTNFDGTVVTEKQLNDKISIVSFIFTQCEGACPIMSENMSTLQERFASSSDIQFLSITTDPDYDTLDILNEYSSNYSNKNNWFFMRGDILDVIELSEKGFSPTVPPVLVRENALYGTGFFPDDAEQVYEIPNDDLYLVGTSEVPLAALHTNEIINMEELPIRYAGFSTCFRREAGTYGKDTTGIFRVHQFDKVEMFSFCNPKKSEEEHEFILSVEEELLQSLEIPYRVVDVCAGDLGASAAKKYDIEAWIPSQNTYREVTSCSNTTSFQARRLNIRAKSDGETNILHTLNGTAIAVGRILIALIENNQTEDGKVEFSDTVAEIIGVKNLG